MWPEEVFYIIPRKEWNAKPPRDVFGLARPARQILVTWTNSDHCHDRSTCLKAMEQLQSEHLDKGLEDIGYSFVVGGDFTVYEGRGWNAVPMLIEEYESLQYTSIVVGVVGKEGMIHTKEKQDVIDKIETFGKSNGFLQQYTTLIPLLGICDHAPKLE